MFFTFDELQTAPLIVDAVYEGGWESRNLADEPLSKIFQGVGSGLGNSGGFRWSGKSSGSGYCVLYTTGNEPDWPDELDLRAGIFTYYGDNRSAGRAVSSKKGNKILESSFASLHASESPRQNIVPFLIFEKFPTERSQRSVRFGGWQCQDLRATPATRILWLFGSRRKISGFKIIEQLSVCWILARFPGVGWPIPKKKINARCMA